MAPITRSGISTVPEPEGLQPPGPVQKFREGGWQFVGADSRSVRELSEEPSLSYDEDADMVEGVDDENGKAYDLVGPEDHEDILHPLREAANRVGREVERFAEVLDGYNPQRATEKDERFENAIILIELYHGIAVDTLKRLREQHESERRKKDSLRWRQKMRGLKVVQEELDFDDEDESNSPPAQLTGVEDLLRWEQEAQTWDLLARLVNLRHSSPEASTNADKSVSHNKPFNPFASEHEIWQTFLETDELALERKTVLQWLKDTAEESGEDIDVLTQELQQNADRGDIIAHGWLHTKAAIKNQKRVHVWAKPLDPTATDVKRLHLNSSQTKPLVTQLDPDAPTRQGLKLQVQDQYFERAIWVGCYEMLRRGRSPVEIREWCTERTEIWRAVSMSGLPDEAVQDSEEIADPSSFALWRRMCFALARNSGEDQYERAVYGILSGDIPTVEPICQSWNDFIFAHYNALLRTQFDSYLQKVHPQSSLSSTSANFGIFDAVQYHGDPESAARRLIETLKNDPRTREETLQPMKMLQGVLIANDFPHFIHQQGLALSKFANADGLSKLIPVEKEHPKDLDQYIHSNDHDSLRVLTHVLLIFMSLGVDLGGIWKQTAVENVIVSYISFLRLAGKEELIPLYSSQLTGPRKYAILSRTLIDITDHEARLVQIGLMRELGLDVQQFVSLQSRFLLMDYPDGSEDYPASDNFRLFKDVPNSNDEEPKMKRDFLGDDDTRIERTDMLLIRSFQWFLLVDGLWSETFTFGTMLYMRFFKHMHLAAAQVLSQVVPTDEIAAVKTPAILGEDFTFAEMERGDEDDLTEVLDGSAERKRLLRQHLLAEAKSFRELEALILTLDSLETISSSQNLVDEYHTKSEAERQQNPYSPSAVKRTVLEEFDKLKAPISMLLDRWLLTFPYEDVEEEFTLLREAYLPETILAYISSLSFAGDMCTREFLMDCMDLAAVVAEEDSGLLALFEKTGRLQELVKAFAFASKTLLLATAEKPGRNKLRKKKKTKGWMPDLWNVKR